MSQLHNLPVEEWPQIRRITFMSGEYKKSFYVNSTRGPGGNTSFVHSVRPEVMHGQLIFFVYFVVDGSSQEILWDIFCGIPFTIEFDTKKGVEGE